MKKCPQLLDTALQLFYRQGFHATGVDQLAQAAGLTKKTLYRYFATKEALIVAVLQQRDQDFLARLAARLAQAVPARQPQAYLDFLQDWFAEPDFNGCLFMHAAAEYPLPDDAIHQQAAAHKQALQAILLAVCEAAVLANAAQCARQLFLLGEGLTVQAQLGGVCADDMAAARALLAHWPVVAKQ